MRWRGFRAPLSLAALACLCASVVTSFGAMPARSDPAPAQSAIVEGDLTHLIYTATQRLEATLISPASSETVTTALGKVAVATVAGAGVELVVGGTPIPLSQLGSRSVNAKDGTTIYTFYGVRFEPGPNAVDVTALGADDMRGETVHTVIFGAGKPVTLAATLAAVIEGDARTPVVLTIHALDAWRRPALTGTSIRASVTAGSVKLLVPSAPAPPATPAPLVPANAVDVAIGRDGAAQLLVVPGATSGDATIAFSSGDARGIVKTFVKPFLRTALVVGVISAGAGAAPGSRDGEDHLDNGGSKRGRAAFFVTGESLRGVATTIAYDTASRLGASAALGPFVDDRDAEPYRTYGDQSAQRADTLSADRLYARLESGRNAFTYGQFSADTGAAGGAPPAFTAVLSGARADLADAGGRVRLTAFTARNDVAYARELIAPTGLSSFVRALHPDIVVGSEIVTLDALDPRTGAVVSETPLQRDVDYTLDPLSGTLRFLSPVLPYDLAFRRQVLVVRYQYAAAAGSRTSGGRFGASLAHGAAEVNLGYVNDASGADNFSLLQQNVRLTTQLGVLEIAHVGSAGAAPGATLDSTGQTWHAELSGRRGGTTYDAAFDRASPGFSDPFGGLTANGLSDMRLSVTQALARKGEWRFAYDAQRDAISGNRQSDLAMALRESLSQRLTAESGFDVRSAGGSAALQARLGAEYAIGDRLKLRAQHIADVGGAGSATQPGQTTIAIDGRIGDATHVVLRQLWQTAAAAPFATSTQALAGSGARNSTTFDVERTVGPSTVVSTAYTLDRGAGGNDFSTSLGIRHAFSLTPRFKANAYVQSASGRGSDATSTNVGTGFTAYGFDLAYGGTGFHASAALAERAGSLGGSSYRLVAAGPLSRDISLVGDVRASHTAGFADDETRIGLAWRPQGNDRGAALLELERKNGDAVATGEHVDTLAAEAAWRATPRLELDARVAYKLDGDGFYAARTYLAGVRAVQRIGAHFDIGAEARALGAPGTNWRPRTQLALESGYRLGSSVRLAIGDNVTGSADPDLVGTPSRRGLYVTITSVVSRVFGWGK